MSNLFCRLHLHLVVVAAEVLVAEGVVQVFDQFVVEDVVFGQLVVRSRRQLVAAGPHRRVVEAEVARIVVSGHVFQELLVVVFLFELVSLIFRKTLRERPKSGINSQNGN